KECLDVCTAHVSGKCRLARHTHRDDNARIQRSHDPVPPSERCCLKALILRHQTDGRRVAMCARPSRFSPSFSFAMPRLKNPAASKSEPQERWRRTVADQDALTMTALFRLAEANVSTGNPRLLACS